MRSQMAAPMPTNRNPYRGKGLRIPVALLLEPGREWTLRELAHATGVSDALASGVVKQLRQEGALPDDVVQGRRATLRATAPLLRRVAEHWPTPDLHVHAGRPPEAGHPIGGAAALEAAGFIAQGRPRVYVRSWEAADRLLARSGGEETTAATADWEVSVLDLDLPNGLLPGTIAALELGASPRGRRTLAERAASLLPPHTS